MKTSFRVLGGVVTTLIALPILYVLSAGPAAYIESHSVRLRLYSSPLYVPLWNFSWESGNWFNKPFSIYMSWWNREPIMIPQTAWDWWNPNPK